MADGRYGEPPQTPEVSADFGSLLLDVVVSHAKLPKSPQTSGVSFAGTRSIDKAARQVPIGIYAAITEERPIAACLFDSAAIAFDDDYFFLIMRRSRQQG